MKRFLLFASLVVLTASVAMTVPAAFFTWRGTSHDFGLISQGKPVTAEFTFTNTGELPLVVNNAKGSCGCTGVDFPKSPVLPGQTAIIKATFNAAVLGAFNKTVIVESNAEGGAKTLYIKGEVVKGATSQR